jgi:hypothetical protein
MLVVCVSSVLIDEIKRIIKQSEIMKYTAVDPHKQRSPTDSD